MTKNLTISTIAEKYRLDESDIEMLFQCYDTNDFYMFKRQFGYLSFILPESSVMEFITDVFKYIKQNTQQ